MKVIQKDKVAAARISPTVAPFLFLKGIRNLFFNSSIIEIEDADTILLVGSNPRWKQVF